MTYPADKRDYNVAKEMKIPLQMDNKDYGKKTTAKPRTVVIKSSGKDGKYYGFRTIMTKEGYSDLMLQLVEAETEITSLPDKVIHEIRKLIRQGAADLEQKWVNALELLHTAYKVANVKRPNPSQKGAWAQYEDLITFAVKQLAATRGIDNSWRTADVVLREQHNQQRFIVDITGAHPAEVEAKDMHEIIDTLSNKLRRQGMRVKVESRDERKAKLSVWHGDSRHMDVSIRDISH